MSSSNRTTTPPPSKPIAIDSPTGRRRSSSVWSNPGLSPSSSVSSSTRPSSLITPTAFTANATFPRPAVASPQASTSPLSYFLAGSPVKPAVTWNNGTPSSITKGLMEGSAIADDDDQTLVPPPSSSPFRKLGHTRSVSNSWSAANHERGVGVMRRLSLGGALGTSTRPRVSPPRETLPVPQNTPATAYPQDSQVHTRTRSEGTPTPHHHRHEDKLGAPILLTPSPKRRGLGRKTGEPVKKRSVSPMGERMLKGHFDGFGL